MRWSARSIEVIFLLAGCSIAIGAGDTPPPPIELSYSPWTKFCQRGHDATAKQVCFTGKDGRSESGQPGVAAVIVESEGEPNKIASRLPSACNSFTERA